jgi:hypothetical protein
VTTGSSVRWTAHIRAVVVSRGVQTSSGRRVDRLIERMPAVVQTDLRESAVRLLAIRSPKQALRAQVHSPTAGNWKSFIDEKVLSIY